MKVRITQTWVNILRKEGHYEKENKAYPLSILRAHRRAEEEATNILIQSGKQNYDKKNIYCWLQDISSMNDKQTHIGQFSNYMYEQVIIESKRLLENHQIACKGRKDRVWIWWPLPDRMPGTL